MTVIVAVLVIVFLLVLVVAGILLYVLLRDRNADVTKLRRASLRAEIVVLTGSQAGERHALTGAEFRIGSDPGSHIRLNDAGVAPVHALIRAESGAFVLQDRRSQNGTWANGRRIFAAAVAPGAQFQIGLTVLALVEPGQPAPAPSDHLHRKAAAAAGVDAGDMITTVGFEPLGQLGVGGQVTVYRARAKADGAELVVKYLNDAPDDGDRGYFRQKFKQQILIGLTIRHPRCVRVLGGDPAHTPPYLIEEYVPGGTLRDRLLRGRLSLDEARRIIGELLDALYYLHGKGIIHRDIKPSNVLLDANAQVKLTDFGLIRIAGSPRVTQLGMCLGTPHYMSLEQIRGDSQLLGPASDLYSVGVLAYELFSGKPPFDGSTDEILAAHLHGKVRPLNEAAPNVPERIAQAVGRALEKDPARRFSNARDMAQALGYERPFEAGQSTQHNAAQQPLRLSLVETGKVLTLNNSPFLFTRALVNPNDKQISREHGQAYVADGSWRIAELPGRPTVNGLYVNGVRVDEEGDIVQTGDQIRLGQTVLRVVDGAQPVSAQQHMGRAAARPHTS
jgi:serine/threonine protein kinase